MSNNHDSTSETKRGLWILLALLALFFSCCGGGIMMLDFGHQSQIPADQRHSFYKFFNPPKQK